MEKHGVNNMKKLNKLFILPLLALSLFNVNNTQSNNSYLQLEETTNDANIIGIRKETTSTSNEDVKVSNILKVQASSEENGKRSLRFVAGISSLSLNAHFHREEIKIKDEVIMIAKDIEVTCAYSKILNGSQEQTASEVFENNEYKYFVAYTLKDIPEEYWSTVINVSLVVGDGKQVATKKANVDAFDESKTNEEWFSFSKLNDGNYAIAVKNDYKATIKELNIPSYYYETTETDNEFVKTTNKITTIGWTLPDNQKVGFIGCTNLTYINIPSTITQINDFAFSTCSSLTTVIFNSGVNIGHYAFVSCDKIERLILPKDTVLEQAPFGVHHENLSIYYEGETIPTSWNKGWKDLSAFKFYLFSSTQPTSTSKPTNVAGYWHYENNIPVEW